MYGTLPENTGGYALLLFMALLCQSVWYPVFPFLRGETRSSSHAAGFARLASKAAHTHFSLAGTELFHSAIPAAQVPLRIATIGKKLKKKFESKQSLSVNIEMCSLFPF